MIYKSKTPGRSQAPAINFVLVFVGVRRVEREFTTRFKIENKRSQAHSDNSDNYYQTTGIYFLMWEKTRKKTKRPEIPENLN